jgi:RNA recognition motif-containing protein
VSEAEKLTRTVFVGNLPKSTTRKELFRFFAKYGAVQGRHISMLFSLLFKIELFHWVPDFSKSCQSTLFRHEYCCCLSQVPLNLLVCGPFRLPG